MLSPLSYLATAPQPFAQLYRTLRTLYTHSTAVLINSTPLTHIITDRRLTWPRMSRSTCTSTTVNDPQLEWLDSIIKNGQPGNSNMYGMSANFPVETLYTSNNPSTTLTVLLVNPPPPPPRRLHKRNLVALLPLPKEALPPPLVEEYEYVPRLHSTPANLPQRGGKLEHASTSRVINGEFAIL